MREDPERLGVADLQVHTSAGDGLASPEDVVRWADARTNLDLLAITDHDSLLGALAAREAAAKIQARVQIIVGMEVTTLRGHLLALFLETPVPSLQSLARTLEAVHAQGGVCVIPHPLSPLPPSLGVRSIDRICALPQSARPPLGIELANPAPVAGIRLRTAQRLNVTRWGLAPTGGSDAHFVQTVGSAVTRYPGRTAADLRRAIVAGLTVPEQRSAPSLRQIGLRKLALQQRRALTATPRAVGGVWWERARNAAARTRA